MKQQINNASKPFFLPHVCWFLSGLTTHQILWGENMKIFLRVVFKQVKTQTKTQWFLSLKQKNLKNSQGNATAQNLKALKILKRKSFQYFQNHYSNFQAWKTLQLFLTCFFFIPYLNGILNFLIQTFFILQTMR